ncbi:MAG: hypothetical protein DCC75_08470 [Proteobacteria bacterium]|nr:MAG: hypothetical protein DCC75_08470 [Pseudomonadota bacterium]
MTSPAPVPATKVGENLRKLLDTLNGRKSGSPVKKVKFDDAIDKLHADGLLEDSQRDALKDHVSKNSQKKLNDGDKFLNLLLEIHSKTTVPSVPAGDRASIAKGLIDAALAPPPPPPPPPPPLPPAPVLTLDQIKRRFILYINRSGLIDGLQQSDRQLLADAITAMNEPAFNDYKKWGQQWINMWHFLRVQLRGRQHDLNPIKEKLCVFKHDSPEHLERLAFLQRASESGLFNEQQDALIEISSKAFDAPIAGRSSLSSALKLLEKRIAVWDVMKPGRDEKGLATLREQILKLSVTKLGLIKTVMGCELFADDAARTAQIAEIQISDEKLPDSDKLSTKYLAQSIRTKMALYALEKAASPGAAPDRPAIIALRDEKLALIQAQVALTKNDKLYEGRSKELLEVTAEIKGATAEQLNKVKDLIAFREKLWDFRLKATGVAAVDADRDFVLEFKDSPLKDRAATILGAELFSDQPKSAIQAIESLKAAPDEAAQRLVFEEIERQMDLYQAAGKGATDAEKAGYRDTILNQPLRKSRLELYGDYILGKGKIRTEDEKSAEAKRVLTLSDADVALERTALADALRGLTEADIRTSLAGLLSKNFTYEEVGGVKRLTWSVPNPVLFAATNLFNLKRGATEVILETDIGTEINERFLNGLRDSFTLTKDEQINPLTSKFFQTMLTKFQVKRLAGGMVYQPAKEKDKAIQVYLGKVADDAEIDFTHIAGATVQLSGKNVKLRVRDSKDAHVMLDSSGKSRAELKMQGGSLSGDVSTVTFSKDTVMREVDIRLANFDNKDGSPKEKATDSFEGANSQKSFKSRMFGTVFRVTPATEKIFAGMWNDLKGDKRIDYLLKRNSQGRSDFNMLRRHAEQMRAAGLPNLTVDIVPPGSVIVDGKVVNYGVIRLQNERHISEMRYTFNSTRENFTAAATLYNYPQGESPAGVASESFDTYTDAMHALVKMKRRIFEEEERISQHKFLEDKYEMRRRNPSTAPSTDAELAKRITGIIY